MRRNLLVIVLLCLLLCVTSVWAQKGPPSQNPPCGDFDTIEINALLSGYDPSPGCDPGEAPPPGCPGEDLVIEDQNTWEGFWLRHMSNIRVWDPVLGEYVPWSGPPPEIDFDEQIVLAVFLGERSTTGHASIVECVQYIESTLLPGTIESVRAHVRELRPGNTCNVGQQFTNPYHIVAVTRPDTLLGSIVNFVHVEETYSCGSGGGQSGVCRICRPGSQPTPGTLPCC
jgi:hypothetical protein